MDVSALAVTIGQGEAQGPGLGQGLGQGPVQEKGVLLGRGKYSAVYQAQVRSLV